jgi:hypothetical protein
MRTLALLSVLLVAGTAAARPTPRPVPLVPTTAPSGGAEHGGSAIGLAFGSGVIGLGVGAALTAGTLQLADEVDGGSAGIAYAVGGFAVLVGVYVLVTSQSGGR